MKDSKGIILPQPFQRTQQTDRHRDIEREIKRWKEEGPHVDKHRRHLCVCRRSLSTSVRWILLLLGKHLIQPFYGIGEHHPLGTGRSL